MRRFMLLFALLAVVSLIAVACGDDDDDAAGDGEAATVTETATSAEAVPEDTEAEDGASPTPIITPTLPPADQLPATATEPSPGESVLIVPPERDESIPRDGRVLGNPDAPVSIVEYGDFQ